MTVIDYLTAILVFVTTIYSYLTHKMVKASEASVLAMREQTEALSRPYVTISPFIRSNTTILYLKIENTGKAAAENLRLSLDKDFFQFGQGKEPEHNLRTKSAFVEPIQNLPPEGKLIFALAQGFVIFASDADSALVPHQFTITATYTFGAKEFIEVNRIDLRAYLGTEGEHDPIVDELEKIRKLAQKLK